MFSLLGCQHRAYLFSKYLTEYVREKFPGKQFIPPKKHFLFGRLKLETENAENRKDVEWYYHVALAVKISGKDDLLVLDPIDSPRHVAKQEYHKIFLKVQGVKLTGFVTCDAN